MWIKPLKLTDEEEEEEEEEDEEVGKQEEVDKGEEEEEEEEDKEEEEDEEEEDKVTEEEGDEEEDEDKEGQEGEQEYEMDDNEDDDLDAALCDTADPFPFRGGEKWQGDPVDEMDTTYKKKTVHKIANKKKVNMTASYSSFENFDNDGSIFASINGDDLKKGGCKEC